MSVKLDCTNFLVWQAIIVSFVECQDLDDFLFGTIACSNKVLDDGSPNPKDKEWYILDRKLSSWLVNTLSLVVASLVVSPVKRKTSFELWTMIQNYCAINNKCHIQVLKKKIHSKRKGSMSMTKYLAKLKELVDTFPMVGTSMHEDDLMFGVLSGFDAEYLPMTAVM
ncbi:hypothetical protein Sjap_012939 [Stephania japonica]|uniref:Retrotransposon Copia-like N-terminal domain-containing protein n=1 Tax=Stephania japonica TaxID=461633 RepID=A0AAP0NX91_9MAGN